MHLSNLLSLLGSHLQMKYDSLEEIFYHRFPHGSDISAYGGSEGAPGRLRGSCVPEQRSEQRCTGAAEMGSLGRKMHCRGGERLEQGERIAALTALLHRGRLPQLIALA